jgi:hypothetical protein
MNIEEAKFALDRKLVELAAENGGEAPLVNDIRFFLFPDPSRRLVLACAERADGPDIEFLFELATPVAGDHLDENAIRTMFFDVPSGLRH